MVSEFFSICCTGWEPVQRVLLGGPGFRNASTCLSWFSIVQSWNQASFFFFLDLLLIEEFSNKVSKILSTCCIG